MWGQETLCSQGGTICMERLAYGFGTLEKDQRYPVRNWQAQKEKLASFQRRSALRGMANLGGFQGKVWCELSSVQLKKKKGNYGVEPYEIAAVQDLLAHKTWYFVWLNLKGLFLCLLYVSYIILIL